MKLALLGALLALASACRIDTNVNTTAAPSASVRWLTPAQTAPHGSGGGTKSWLVSTQPDGTRTWTLVLAAGDDVNVALLEFAKRERLTNAHFSAIGAVSGPEVGWYDLGRKQYKAMAIAEQVEVLSLSGDVVLSPQREPTVHAHAVLGRADGSTWGGHLMHATVSPMLEVYLTSYPTGLGKEHDPATGVDRIDGPAQGSR